MRNIYLSGIAVLCSVLALSACSSVSTQATKDMALRTETSINQAEEMKADEYAPLALRSAKMKLQEARDEIAKENYEKAQPLLEKAFIDAQYASVKSGSEKSQAAAKQIKNDIETLQSEINKS